jgi:glycerol kinase
MTARTDYLGAIDQGTSGTRFIVYDRSADVVAAAYVGHDPARPAPGRVEHDPLRLWENTVDVVRRGCEQAGLDGTDLAAIGIANQRQTAVLWDARTGEPVHDAIGWRDRRTTDRICRLHADGRAADIRRQTGLVPDAYFFASKLEWLLDRVDDRSEHLRAGTVDAWLLSKLTGTHATDVTNAAQTMLFDVDELAWSPDLLEEFGVPRSVLPTVRPSSDTAGYGETTVGGYFDTPVPVTGVLGDQQAALLGHGCLDPGDAKVTYGTGSFAICNTGHERVESDAGALSTVVYQAAGEPPMYGLEAPVLTGGAVFDWLRGVGLIDRPVDIERVLHEATRPADVCLVPGFRGLAAPHWIRTPCATFVGMTADSDGDDLVHAAVESVAYRVREAIDAIAADHDVASPVHVDGGVAENDDFCRLQSAVLNVPLGRPDDVTTAALGAAFAAGRAVDFWTPAEFRSHLSHPTRFDADDPRHRAFERWSRAVSLATQWVPESRSRR